MTKDTKTYLTLISIATGLIIIVMGLIGFRRAWLSIDNDPIASALRSCANREKITQDQYIIIDAVPSSTDGLALQSRSYQIGSWYNYDCLSANDCKTVYCTQEKFDNNKCYSQMNQTCASRDYPRGTKLKVTNIKNGKWIICRVNDFIEHPDRDIDLSSKSFEWLADLKIGIIEVNIEEFN